MSHTEEDSLSLTIVFGVLGLLVAVVGISIAVLQLRHMLRRTKTVEIFELPCKTKALPIVEQYTDLSTERLKSNEKRLEKRSKARPTGQIVWMTDPRTIYCARGSG